MADVVQFFLKMAGDGDDLGQPYLLAFGIERGHVAMAAEGARSVLDALRASGEFADDAAAARHGLAEAILADGHMDAEVRHVMATVVVFLATDTADKRAVMAAGATQVGFVLTPGKVAPQMDFRFVATPSA